MAVITSNSFAEEPLHQQFLEPTIPVVNRGIINVKSVFINWYHIIKGTKRTLVPRSGRKFPNFRPQEPCQRYVSVSTSS